MFRSQNTVSFERRNILILIVIALFAVLIGRLYHIQIVQYSRFVGIAEANRIRIVPLEAQRGIIHDRNGQIIADNKSQYNINIIPFEVRSSEKTYNILGDFLGLTKNQIQRRINHNWRGQFSPARVAEDINFKILTNLEEHKLDLPGVLYSLEPIRSFPSRVNLPHVLGYLREVSKEDLKSKKYFGYRAGDLIGWKGVEREYEKILRGKRGYDYLQVDVHGREVGSLQDKEKILPKPGNDLYLTIDLDLQVYAESIMGSKRGAIIVMDSNSGEILSLISKPDYSPNLFSGIIEPSVWDKLRDNPDQPLYNRVTQGTYSPGSAFKIVAAMAALENGVVDSNWTVRCRGKYRLGRRVFKCWRERGHGRMNMHDAITNSCNVYFYNLIRKMDIDIWADNARIFGFGSKTNIDLPEESNGIVPDTEFLDRKYEVGGWAEGNKLNLVIGQGDLLVTPIQMARFTAALATRGKLVQPHVGLRYFNKELNNFILFSSEIDSIEDYSESTWNFIQYSMFDVVNHRNGTARSARVKGLKVYGKTGTAQNPHGDPHAWFIGFTKDRNRSIAIVVLVEHGGSGGSAAAPIAGKLFRYCYEKNINQMIVSSGNSEI